MAQRFARPGDLSRWLTNHLPDLQSDPYRRELNGVPAVILLPWFLDDPSLWRDCGRLNCWDPYVNATFADYVDSWARHLRRVGTPPYAPPLIGASFFGTSAAPPALPPPPRVAGMKGHDG